jgi:mono/diheme cytochrome c family protein
MTGKRAGLLLAGLATALGAGACGPRMRTTPGLRPFEEQMPQLPPGTVPREGRAPMPSPDQAAGLVNPLPASREVLAAGERYYGYYCQHCHGSDGRGRTPVGESYNPEPTDLGGLSVARMRDGELYRGMLLGVGHEPVLEATVPRDRRWPIVAYVRSLGNPQQRPMERMP